MIPGTTTTEKSAPTASDIEQQVARLYHFLCFNRGVTTQITSTKETAQKYNDVK